MRSKSLFAILIMLLVFSCVKVRSQVKYSHTMEAINHSFDSLLVVVDKNVNSNWEPPLNFLLMEGFKVVFDNPLNYIDPIRRSFANKNLNECQKMICLYAMQELPLEEYVALSSYCLQLVKDGSLDEKILNHMVFPPMFTTDRRFCDNYRVKEVRSFLKAIIKDKTLSKSTRQSMQYIYSGRMFREREKMRKNGYDDSRI